MAETEVETAWPALFEGKGSLETVSPAPASIATPIDAIPANRSAPLRFVPLPLRTLSERAFCGGAARRWPT